VKFTETHARATRASCNYFPAAKHTVSPELPAPAIAAELLVGTTRGRF
jgi:hypothetical protein